MEFICPIDVGGPAGLYSLVHLALTGIVVVSGSGFLTAGIVAFRRERAGGRGLEARHATASRTSASDPRSRTA